MKPSEREVVEVNGKDLITAAVLAALVLVVGAYFVVASAQARSPVQQCFDARMYFLIDPSGWEDLEEVGRRNIEARSWAYCINGGP